MGRSIFYEKNLRIQFDLVFDSESNGGIFDSLTRFGDELWRLKQENHPKNFCVGCSCRTNFRFSNRDNIPPNGAKESKIPPFDSESKTTSNCILKFFSKKIDRPTLFSFYHSLLSSIFLAAVILIIIYRL